jgi:hypothetical protein
MTLGAAAMTQDLGLTAVTARWLDGGHLRSCGLSAREILVRQ